MKKVKKVINCIIEKIKIFIKEKIPNFFYAYIVSYRLEKIFMENGITEIEKFNVKSWHLGYRYYIGKMQEKKVFIKYNKNQNWILHEVEILKELEQKSQLLSKKIPKLYDYKINPNFGFLIEEFFNYKSIKNIIDENEVVDKEKVFGEFIKIIEEFQEIGFMHLDINLNNLYLNDCNEVFFLDFGFSFFKEKINFDYIGNEHKKSLILSNLNKDTRLEEGYIDDAVSFLNISKKFEPNLVSTYNYIWNKMNDLSEKLFLNLESVDKNENK